MSAVNLFDLLPSELESLAESLGAPPYRGRQIATWIYKKAAGDIDAMSTFLGASSRLTAADIDVRLVARARIVYLEGYLFDPAEAQEAFRTAARMAHADVRNG